MDIAARIREILHAEAEAIRSIEVDESFERAVAAMESWSASRWPAT